MRHAAISSGIAVLLLLNESCTHTVQTVSRATRQPAPAAVKTRRVENAIDAGDGDVEARALRQRLAANAKDLDARLELARLYARRGLPDLALEHYRFAAAQFPDSVEVTMALAKALRQFGETRQALETVESALARHTEGNWGLLSLEGILHDERGDFVAAEKAHRAAMALNPARSGLHNNLGYNLLLQGKPDGAAAEFRRALEIDAHSERARNNLGTALAAESHSKEALAEWQRASDPAAAHNNLAALYLEQGRYAEAREELQAALALRRNFPAAMANLRLVAEKDGQPATVAAQRRPVKKGRSAAVSANAAPVSTHADAGN